MKAIILQPDGSSGSMQNYLAGEGYEFDYQEIPG